VFNDHKTKSINKKNQRTMKKILFAIMALAISTCAFAQQPQRGERRQFKPEDMAQRQTERIKKACETNEKQDKALYDYFLRQANQMQAQRAKMQQGDRQQRQEGDRENFRAEMEKRQKAQNDTIKSILTKDQYAKYEKMQQEMRNRGPRGGQGNSRNERPQRNNN